MNSYCLLTNCAALSFKVLMKNGVSVIVLALFRNIVLLLCSLSLAFYLKKACFMKRDTNHASQQSTLDPLQLLSTPFLLA